MTAPSLSVSIHPRVQPRAPDDCRMMAALPARASENSMGIGFRELLVILVIALVIFGAKRLKTVGSALGAAVRGFKKAVNEGEEEQTNQQLTDQGRNADFAERTTNATDKKSAWSRHVRGRIQRAP